jgi:hypothetical protein
MFAQELVTMSAKEVDRLEVVRRVLERRLKRVKVAQLLGSTARQVRRLCDAYQRDGAAGLVSKRRGQPSNHQRSEELQRRAVALVHCAGKLAQIDGCEHAWFEDRGPYCSLLFYVDDATGRLMELLFTQAGTSSS